MNERIKELAEQAIEEKQSLDEFIAAVKLNPNGYYGFSIAELEKFAELIVQECAKVILETPVKYTEIDIMHIIRDNVKEHFGVEE